VGSLAIDHRQLSSQTFLHPNTYGHDCLVLTLAVGVKGNRSNSAFARRAYALGKLIDEGGIQQIMRANVLSAGITKLMDQGVGKV
jgi:hypothetical protein